MEIKGYSSLWKAVIRPPRAEYEIKDLGPSDFMIDRLRVKRTDIQLTNQHGHAIQCSHFEPHDTHRHWEEMPCVIYLHGNSSCRLEALDAVQYLLPSNITLFCFDFAGCGLSGGEYISLGWWEREDLGLIVEHLRKERKCSTIGLWGRSMGAVTSLLHGDRDPSIGGMVLDSPFADMKQLVSELAKTYTKIPSIFVSAAMKLVRSSIKSKANFDVYDLTPISHVKECFIPALFAAANSDDFILPHHSEELHAAYAGDKNLVKLEGDHNSPRPSFFFDSVVIFFHNTLQVSSLCREDNKVSRISYPKLNPPNPGANFPINDSTISDNSSNYHGGGFDLGHSYMGAMPFNQQSQQYAPEDDFEFFDEDEIMRQILQESLETAKREEETRKKEEQKQGAGVAPHKGPSMAPPKD